MRLAWKSREISRLGICRYEFGRRLQPSTCDPKFRSVAKCTCHGTAKRRRKARQIPRCSTRLIPSFTLREAWRMSWVKTTAEPALTGSSTERSLRSFLSSPKRPAPGQEKLALWGPVHRALSSLPAKIDTELLKDGALHEGVDIGQDHRVSHQVQHGRFFI